MDLVQSFPPLVSERNKLLILGTMPGERSLKAGQYYARPRNAFWHIIGELFGAGPSRGNAVRGAVCCASLIMWLNLSIRRMKSSMPTRAQTGDCKRRLNHVCSKHTVNLRGYHRLQDQR
jgi:double-stranded uracil-DNA glycosylase